MRSGVALWRTLLVTGVALVVVAVSRHDHVFGEGGTWIAKAPIPTPRRGLAIGVVNGILYAVGGAIAHTGIGGYMEYPSTVEAYDPSTNSWSSKAPLPTPRSGLCVGVVDGILYALGGSTSQAGPIDTMEAYDPVRNTWTAKAPMPTRRWVYAVGVARGTLYVVGGSTGTETGLVETYDPITNRWTAKAPMPTLRAAVGVGVMNGILYAIGGVAADTTLGHGGSHTLSTVEAYDPTTNTWTAKAPMPTPRYGLAVGVANQVLYAVGGNSKVNIRANVMEAYDPVRNVWTTKAPLPGNRNFVGLGSVDGILYAVGGVRWEPAPDTPACGSTPCYRIVEDPITYAFKAVP